MMRQGKWSIPTTYGGIRFRSRLEADWARFFDRHRMKYAYEPEGFDLGGVRYLPDFYLPDIKTFVEVKGVLDDIDREKVFALARAAAPKGIMVILAEAPAGERFRLAFPTPQCLEFESPDTHYEDQLSEDVGLVLCARCGQWFFVEWWASWRCSACGHQDGDNTYKAIHGQDRCPDCGADRP